MLLLRWMFGPRFGSCHQPQPAASRCRRCRPLLVRWPCAVTGCREAKEARYAVSRPPGGRNPRSREPTLQGVCCRACLGSRNASMVRRRPVTLRKSGPGSGGGRCAGGRSPPCCAVPCPGAPFAAAPRSRRPTVPAAALAPPCKHLTANNPCGTAPSRVSAPQQLAASLSTGHGAHRCAQAAWERDWQRRRHCRQQRRQGAPSPASLQAGDSCMLMHLQAESRHAASRGLLAGPGYDHGAPGSRCGAAGLLYGPC